MQVTEQRKTSTFRRFVQLQKEAVDVEKRTVSLAFSSEEPYDRYYGTEILDHDAKSIRLGRLKNGGAVLLDHTPSRHVGVVEKVDLGDDRIARAVVRFGRSAEAEAAFQDVQDGIRQHVSVGYFVHRMVMEEEKEGHETYRVMDWEPIEVSLVAIPADPTVGVGRTADAPEITTTVVREIADATPRLTLTGKERKMDKEQQQPDPAAAERARVDAIAELGKQYGRFVDSNDVVAAIRSGKTPEQFKDVVMDKMTTKHTDTSAAHVGMSDKEVQRYSIARACAAMLTGDWSQAGLEREANQAVIKMLGKTPEGFFVPFDAFKRDFNVGTSTQAGNLVATDLRTDLYVDVLRNALVASRLGVRILAGLTSNIDIPRKAVASSLAMVTEIQALTETNPQTNKVTLAPKRFGAYVEYSKQAIIQSSMQMEGMLRDDLLQGGAVMIEDQLINGSGSGANMRGLRNTSGIGAVVGGTNGAALAWSHVVGLESACANANAEPDRFSGYLINTKVRGTAKTTQKAANLPFIWDNGEQPLNGYRAAVSNNVPSNLTKGTASGICSSVIFGSDWSMAVLGLFGAPDVTVDPYTLATTGQVRITLNQFADLGVRQAACFATADDILTP